MNPANQNGIDMLKKLGADTGNFEKEVIVPEDILKTYIGRYELNPGFILTVTKEGNQMKVQATGQPIFDIFPASNEKFYLKAIVAQIVFNKGGNGEIESFTLFQGGQEMICKKLPE
jgi:hypothetical protein